MSSVSAGASSEDDGEMPCGIATSNNVFEYRQEREVHDVGVVILPSIQINLEASLKTEHEEIYRENSTTSAQTRNSALLSADQLDALQIIISLLLTRCASVFLQAAHRTGKDSSEVVETSCGESWSTRSHKSKTGWLCTISACKALADKALKADWQAANIADWHDRSSALYL